MALARTIERRPDLIDARGGLTAEERALLADHGVDPYHGTSPQELFEEPDAP
jgi:hypothetical protein